MMIHVKLLANYREHLPPEAKNGGMELDVPDGITVREVLSRFPIPLDETSVIVVNGATVDLDTPLKAGDVVSAFSAIAGG
jgi:molybdopterin converting factor small subunit